MQTIEIWSEFPVAASQNITSRTTGEVKTIRTVTATGKWKKETRAGAGFGMRTIKVQQYLCEVA